MREQHMTVRGIAMFRHRVLGEGIWYTAPELFGDRKFRGEQAEQELTHEIRRATDSESQAAARSFCEVDRPL